MMDMDHFKHINDEYGHLEGDAALVLLAGILKKVCVNYNGVLARYGGDEFCIACGCNSVEVRTLIASIQRELRRQRRLRQALPDRDQHRLRPP